MFLRSLTFTFTAFGKRDMKLPTVAPTLNRLRLLALVAAMALPAGVVADFSDVEVRVDTLGAPFVREGPMVDKNAIEGLMSGMSTTEVREALGDPDTMENKRNRQEFHYTFLVPLSPTSGDTTLACQFRANFDVNGRLMGSDWRRFVCQQAYATLSVDPAAPEILRLASDVLFGFDRAELTPQGRVELGRVATNLRERYRDPVITLVGYSDRIGARDYNIRLSQRRAEAVRTELVRQGIDRSRVIAEGRGPENPIVECSGTGRSAELIACLEPNRRVEIEVVDRDVSTN